jgi:Secretion system C-terminal sorting domain
VQLFLLALEFSKWISFLLILKFRVMKTFFSFSFCVLITLSSFCQNNPPIAVNDTLFFDFNDSISFTQLSGGVLSGNPYSFLANDSEPDGNFIFVDTAYYSGLGQFNITTDSLAPTIDRSIINYKPGLNFYGLDSVLLVIKDDGSPVLKDSSFIYFKVKRQEFEYVDLNNIKARFGLNNLFYDEKNGLADFEVPKRTSPSAPKQTTIFAGNLWIAGKNQGSVYLDAVTYGAVSNPNPLTAFFSRSGPIMDSMFYQQYDYKWDRLWKINTNEINYHNANWSNAGYQPIEVIANWPAHGDTAKGQAADLAPFIDNNNDGVYNPYDGDYPKIKGQQAVYFIYNDVNYFSGSQSGGPTMRSETHYMAYAYNCPSDSAINNTVFLDYTIYNRSNLTYDSTYLGFWADLDIGNAEDDYVGSDVERGTFYGYNGDNLDEDNSGVLGYQNYPPAQGVTFLKGAKQNNDGVDNPFTPIIQDAVDSSGIPYAGLGVGFGDGITDNENWGMEHFIYYNLGAQFAGDGSPGTDLDFYNYLQSIWKDGTQMVYGGNGHISGGGTVPANYMFPNNSDPLWYGTKGIAPSPTNWSETNAAAGGTPNTPFDRRGLGSTGPFTFYPDSSVEITLALVFGRDYQTTGNQAGIVVMQERIDSIRSYYLNNFSSVCGGGLVSVSESKEKENSLLIYPNPFNNEITINYELQNSAATLAIYTLLGENLMNKKITQNSTKINLNKFSSGVYFLQIIDGKSRINQKIIKQ